MTGLHGTFKPLTDRESAEMDSLRGASAIAVVIGHANQVLVAPSFDIFSPYLGLLAQAAVMVFFVLSGFLIGKSICRNVDRHGGQLAPLPYISDRALRVMPALIFSIFLVLALCRMAPLVFPSGTSEFLPDASYLARTGMHYDWHAMLWSLLFQNGFHSVTPDANGPLWSLSIEVWYYALAAIIIVLYRRPLLLIGSLAVIAYLARVNDAFFQYLAIWFAGYALSILHNREMIPSVTILRAAIAICASITIFFAVLCVAHPDWIVYFNISFGISFAFVLAALLQGSLRCPIHFAKSARYSYTLYIVHVPIFLFVFGVAQPHIQHSTLKSIAVAVVSIAGAIFFASTAARIVENKAALKGIFRRVATIAPIKY